MPPHADRRRGLSGDNGKASESPRLDLGCGLLDSQVAPCSAAPHARSPMIMQLRLGAVLWLLGVALAQGAMPSRELGGQSG
jgi:hypothetical protein